MKRDRAEYVNVVKKLKKRKEESSRSLSLSLLHRQ